MSHWWVWGDSSNKQIIIAENDIRIIFLTGTESYKLTETMFDNKIKYSTVNILRRARKIAPVYFIVFCFIYLQCDHP